MLTKYIKFNNSDKLKDLSDYTRSAMPTAVFGVVSPLKYAIVPSLFKKALYITKDALSARRAAEEIESFSGKKTVFLAAKDDVLLYNKCFNKDKIFERLSAINQIRQGTDYIVCSFEALLQLFPVKTQVLELEKGKEYLLSDIIKTFVVMGYTRKEFVEGKGDFSLRGDILEVYPINSNTAYRCDFFGDELEKVRLYDAYLRETGVECNAFSVSGSKDFFVDSTDIEEIRKRLDESASKFTSPFARNKAREIVEEIKSLLEESPNDSALSYILPLLDHSKNGIFDFITKEFVIVFDESKMINENIEGLIREHSERCANLALAGQAFDFTKNQYYQLSEIYKHFTSHACFAVQSLSTAIPFFNPLRTIGLSSTGLQRYSSRPEDLYIDIKNWLKCGYKTVITCGTFQRAQKMREDLTANGIFDHVGGNNDLNECGVLVTSDMLGNGFIFHDAKLVIIGTGDIYVALRDKRIKTRRKDTFSAPNVGDYAVHEKHGIGLVKGTERISTTEGTKDYVAIEYLGGDFLYVPVEQLDRLTKYLGGENPKLSRLGGMEFERIKERVRQSISQLSINLKQLYNDRKNKQGFKFSADNELSLEFDEAFEFEETEDQIQSIEEIKRDMESTKVMDRLLCGDVGFGKTEVALRAAFKAVMDGKQVALVAPTTILTQQHYETCLKRFKGFGVRIAILNRFCTPQKTNAVIGGIESGEIDLVIGTHKLFSKEIKFSDLGLLILDEEQCFGVEHKEKLRLLKNNVDTLVMTATPIPRTLHMSLSGIRDISLINTPPSNRIPVQAYVIEESEPLLRDAVLRELARGGQVFVLYNRVETIYKFSSRLADVIPEAKIITAHGQMNKNQLENSIMDFYAGRYNVLVSTTIIENGIDLPEANTLIVIDADLLGLFTLYQLKGRVGRSNRMAHAYFTHKPDKVLSEGAYKRLSALMEHTELGSGYKIAMRDLEIRGAGNVLGKEQHGHMDKIGYELYSKLLKEQLGEVTKNFETELDIRIDAYIPNDFIEGPATRLDCYKIISELKSVEDADKIRREITEGYGKIPDEVENLINIAIFKLCARQAKVVKAVVSKKDAHLIMAGVDSLCGGVQGALKEFNKQSVLSFEENPKITFHNSQTTVETLANMTKFLLFSLKK